MQICPVCGFRQTDEETHCVRCNALLASGVDHEAEDFAAGRERRRRARSPLGAGLTGRLARLDPLRLRGWLARRFRRLIPYVASPLPEDVHYRNPWKAAFLGLIPGGGQFYNRQPKKAIFFIAVWVALGAWAAATFTHPHSNIVLGLCILWMAYAFHDGLKIAVMINRQYWNLQRSLAAYLAWLFEVGLFFIIAQAVCSAMFAKFVSLNQPVGSHFQPGERVVVDIFTPLFRGYRPGDIVYYDPKSVGIESGSNVFVVDAKTMIERVVAGPGQTFERRDGRYYLDGIEVSDAYGPLVRGQVHWDYAFAAGEDEYVIIFSHTPRGSLGMTAAIRGIAGAPPLRPHSRGWDEACVVNEDDIIGRLWFVYHPPERRRFVKTPPPPTGVK